MAELGHYSALLPETLDSCDCHTSQVEGAVDKKGMLPSEKDARYPVLHAETIILPVHHASLINDNDADYNPNSMLDNIIFQS